MSDPRAVGKVELVGPLEPGQFLVVTLTGGDWTEDDLHSVHDGLRPSLLASGIDPDRMVVADHRIEFRIVQPDPPE